MPYTGKVGYFRTPSGAVVGKVGPTYLTGAEAAALIVAERFPEPAVMLAVCKEESLLSPDAEGDLLIQDAEWGPSLGLFQIRSRSAERGTGTGRDALVLKDPKRNVREARLLYDARGYSPWASYTSGRYRKHLAWAEGVLAGLDEGGSMPTSQNGWPASSSPSAIGVKPFIVAGASFPGGVKGGDVAVVLCYVAEQFHRRVEKLRDGWCWGYAYRNVRGSGSVSNHASATSIDCNAPNHPLGKRGTFSPTQVKEIHAILREVDGVVRWGGDYSGRPDEMHFEINANASKVRAVAERLNRNEEDFLMAVDEKRFAKLEEQVTEIWKALFKKSEGTIQEHLNLIEDKVDALDVPRKKAG